MEFFKEQNQKEEQSNDETTNVNWGKHSHKLPVIVVVVVVLVAFLGIVAQFASTRLGVAERYKPKERVLWNCLFISI